MSKSTPTPWQPIYGDMPEDVGGGKYLRHYAGPDGKIISLVGFALAGGTDTEEAEANAAYIVKAVNSHAAMVEALTAAERELEAIGPMPTYDTYDDRRRLMLGTVKALHHIRAALTLSQGEQP